MAKRKKYKLQKIAGFYPICALIGGVSPLSNTPIDYGNKMPVKKETIKHDTQGFMKILRPKGGIFTKKIK